MLIGQRGNKILLEFKTRTIEITLNEFNELTNNIKSKISANTLGLMKANKEILSKSKS